VSDPAVCLLKDILKQLTFVDLRLADPSERDAVRSELWVRLRSYETLKITDHLPALSVDSHQG
jgi:hypothetical protein